MQAGTLRKFGSLFWQNLDVDRLFDAAAVLSFYFALSLFPGLVALFSVLSFIPSEWISNESSVSWLQYAPHSIEKLTRSILIDVAGAADAKLFSVGFLLALWVSGNGTAAVVRQLNKGYQVQETRSLVHVRLLATFLACGLGVFALAPLLLYFLRDLLLSEFYQAQEWGPLVLGLFTAFRFLILVSWICGGFLFIYFFGPNLRQRFFDLLPGSLFGAVTLALLAKVFEIYIREIANYDEVYGNFAAAVVLLLWLYLVGLMLVIGADLNKVFVKIRSPGLPPPA